MLYTKGIFEDIMLEEERIQKARENAIAKVKKIAGVVVFSLTVGIAFYRFLYLASECINVF